MPPLRSRSAALAKTTSPCFFVCLLRLVSKSCSARITSPARLVCRPRRPFVSSILRTTSRLCLRFDIQVDFLEARDAWLADAANRAGHGSGTGGGDLQLGAANGTATTSPYQVKGHTKKVVVVFTPGWRHKT